MFNALILVASLLAAQETPLRQAKKHFHAGEVAYKLGRFEDALAEFTKAYEAKALPAFLFNIGQCHKELKNYDRAIFFYEGYLRENPDAADRAVVTGLLEDTKKLLRAAPVQANADDKRHQELDDRMARAPLVVAPATVPVSAPGTASMVVASRPALVTYSPLSWLGITGIVVASGGAVVLGVGTYFGLHSNALYSSIHYSAGTTQAAGHSINVQANLAAYQADAMFIGGGAAVALGATLLIVDLVWPKLRQHTTVAANAGGGGVNVAF